MTSSGWPDMLLAAAAVVLLSPVAFGFNLTLLHVNDIHARMEETNKRSSPCRWGRAYRRGWKAKEEKIYTYTVYMYSLPP